MKKTQRGIANAVYKEHIIREPSLAEIYDEERPSCKQTLGIFF